MKEINNKVKLLILIISIVIIAGIAIMATLGFNFDLKYQESKKIELFINKEFEISDIKQITNEVLQNKQVIIQKVEMFEDTVSIISKDITDEEKANLITKINEKYGTELSSDKIQIVTIPHTKGRDIIKPYIIPLVISTAIILGYMAIRYYKLNSLKIILKTIIAIILVQIIVFSVIAITRLPIGNLIMPIMITIYVLTLLLITNRFENSIETIKEQENEQMEN